MDSYGKVIKLRRKELKMTQMELCKGICSHTYLSKVENEKVEAHPDTLKLLMERIGISQHKDNSAAHSMRLKEELEKINKSLFLSPASMSAVREDFNSVISVDRYVLDPKIELFTRLTNLRLFILESDYQSALRVVEHMNSIFSQLEEDNRFYFILYSGLFHLTFHTSERALSQLSKVNMQHNSYLGIPVWAKGYYYYVLSLCHSYRYNTSKSLYYVEQALEIFKSQFFISRSIDCYTLKGICNYRLKDYNRAIEDFNICVDYLTEQGDLKRIAKVYHNLGLVNKALDKNEEAIEYFEMAIDVKRSISDSSEPLSHLNLIKVYFSLNKLEEARTLLDHLNNYSESQKSEIGLLSILMDSEASIVNREKEINGYMKQLNSLEKWKEIKDFSVWFAEAYAAIYQYKKSNQFYQQAVHAYSKIS